MARQHNVVVSRHVGVDLLQNLRPFGVVHAVATLSLRRPVVAIMVAVDSEERNAGRRMGNRRLHPTNHVSIVACSKRLERIRRREVARMDDCVKPDLLRKRPKKPDRRT